MNDTLSRCMLDNWDSIAMLFPAVEVLILSICSISEPCKEKDAYRSKFVAQYKPLLPGRNSYGYQDKYRIRVFTSSTLRRQCSIHAATFSLNASIVRLHEPSKPGLFIEICDCRNLQKKTDFTISPAKPYLARF